jgi:hypothetical protein
MNLECCKTISVSRPVKRHGVGLFGAALLSIAITGCGDAKPKQVPVFPAKGTITFKGEPTAGAVIGLHPKAPPTDQYPSPRASVGVDGSFKITTYAGGDGAPEGDYAVTVLWYKPIKNGNDVTSGPNVIPAKYMKAETTDIEVKIVAGENNLPPIQL